MGYYVALLHMKDETINQTYRQDHLDYLSQLVSEGKIFAKGPFADGSGGMVIYEAPSYDEAKQLAENDPYITKGVRTLELKEWRLVKG